MSTIIVPSIFKMNTYLLLNKQRIKYRHCNPSTTCSTDLVDHGCFISNITKLFITYNSIKKNKKDIAIDNNVSSNTVQRIIDSYYDSNTLSFY